MKNQSYKITLLTFFFIFTSYSNNLKLLVFIIDSDIIPYNKELKNLWINYTDKYHNNIKGYFIKCNPYIDNEFMVEKNIIWTKTEDSLLPGIANKITLSIEATEKNIDDFDFILITQLSTFYIFDKLLLLLEKQPKNNFFSIPESYLSQPFLFSYSPYIISIDIAKKLLESKKLLMNKVNLGDNILNKCFEILSKNNASFTMHNNQEIYAMQNGSNNDSTINFLNNKLNNTLLEKTLDEIFLIKELLKTYYNQ